MGFLGFTGCSECGIAVPLGELDAHECDREQWVAYRLAKGRTEIESIERELARYLETARGRFERWYAERSR